MDTGEKITSGFLKDDSSINLKYVVDSSIKKSEIKEDSVTYLNNLNLLFEKNFDCSIVATPTTTHFEIVKKLLENKKHVLVEKPIALDKKSVEKLIDLSKK